MFNRKIFMLAIIACGAALVLSSPSKSWAWEDMGVSDTQENKGDIDQLCYPIALCRWCDDHPADTSCPPAPRCCYGWFASFPLPIKDGTVGVQNGGTPTLE